tara:strand:+ start:748 stop:1296 length:549 start_codon:yes stop_codon:yes gene_type:complete
MNYKRVFDILLKPEITDEEIREVYDFTKNNQYDQKKFNNFFIKKLGFDIDDKKNPLTPDQLKKFMKLVGEMNMKDMLDILETPDDEDVKKDVQKNKRSNKRSNKKKKKRTKNQKKKGGNADINKLFKNIKSFTAYKKIYRAVHRLLHNYFKVEKIPKSKMKQHFLSLKPLQYIEIFNNPKYQ